MYTCRECENEVNQGTEICPHCGTDLTAPIPGADARSAKPGLRKILIRWGLLLGVLLGAIWSFLSLIVPGRQGNPTAQAEARVDESLREVRTVLRDYAEQNGGYPRQFEALGDPARTAAQLARSVNYQIQYTPGQVEGDGLIRSYELQARAGNNGFLNFYTDGSGVVRVTRENRSATAQDSPY
jgi:hypothetical protein